MGTLSALQGFCVIGVVIFIGYLAARANVGGPTAQMVLQRFAFFVASPCLMFSIISKEDLASMVTTSEIVAFGCAVITGLIFVVLAKAVFHLNLADTTVGTLASMYMNSNNIGLPVATYILGDAAAVTPIIVMQQVIFTPIALVALDVSATGKANILETTKHLFSNPLLIGVLLGVAVSGICQATGVFIVPNFLYDPIDVIGGSAVPLILCAFGMSLRGARPLAHKDGIPAILTAASLKCIVMPLIAFVLANALGIEGNALYACVVLAALPSAQNVYNYAARYEAGTTFARDAVLLSTMASPVFIFIIAWLMS